jgi:thymidylate synthase
MEIEGESLDDILMCLYDHLPSNGLSNAGSRGETIELLGTSLRLRHPRTRLSRSENRGKSFSALGELLWYFSGGNDLSFVKEYVPAYEKEADDDGTIHGGYGPRLFAMRGSIDQLSSISELLKQRPSTRRAVVQLFNAEDIASPHKEVPCTTTMQFFIRNERLHMATTMRSNDAYKGLPHDIFCFTMIQEMLASELRTDLGEYYHFAGSMHVYAEDLDKLATYKEEGYHRLAEMPSMPQGGYRKEISAMLDCERRMRAGEYFDASTVLQDPYWADLTRLLQAFWASGMEERLDDLALSFDNPIYRTYLDSRRKMRPRQATGREGS